MYFEDDWKWTSAVIMCAFEGQQYLVDCWITFLLLIQFFKLQKTRLKGFTGPKWLPDISVFMPNFLFLPWQRPLPAAESQPPPSAGPVAPPAAPRWAAGDADRAGCASPSWAASTGCPAARRTWMEQPTPRASPLARARAVVGNIWAAGREWCQSRRAAPRRPAATVTWCWWTETAAATGRARTAAWRATQSRSSSSTEMTSAWTPSTTSMQYQ